jgi:hypothetical protein
MRKQRGAGRRPAVRSLRALGNSRRFARDVRLEDEFANAILAAASATGRSSAKLRRSPLTEYCRAGNVTFWPPPLRRSQIAKPISLRPASGPSLKCSSASASLPGGLPGRSR